MAVALTKEKLLEITGGASAASKERISFRGVEFDSREIKGGELFVALKGDAEHGEKFLEGAFSRGAAMALVEDASLLKTSPYAERLVAVKDSLAGFWALAGWWRRELKLPLAAVTGSVGKTTTKEILAAILLKKGRGTYSLKSHNNHVGVPYTICRTAADHEWIVLEIGMNHAGEIERLSKLACPDVAVITKIAPAHIEMLGSIEAIARAKLEILAGLPSGHALVVPRGDEVLAKELAALPPATLPSVRTFGSEEGSDVRVADVKGRGLGGISFRLTLGNESIEVSMSAVGEHNALNAACAALTATLLFPDLPLASIKAGLEEFRAPLMRLNIKDLSGGRKLVDDSYNANPASMAALLELAGDLKRQGSRVALIVGDMLELGEFAERYHRELGEHIAALGPEFVIAVGKFAPLLTQPSRERGIKVMIAENQVSAGHIATKVNFDILLVKASRGVGLEKAVKVVLEQLGTA